MERKADRTIKKISGGHSVCSHAVVFMCEHTSMYVHVWMYVLGNRDDVNKTQINRGESHAAPIMVRSKRKEIKTCDNGGEPCH